MDEKEGFGEISAADFETGDIVEWRSWDEKEHTWNTQYGIIIKTENKIQSNRVVSVSRVMPINGPQIEREFFTLTLKLVNKL